jgi:hypothetical protein
MSMLLQTALAAETHLAEGLTYNNNNNNNDNNNKTVKVHSLECTEIPKAFLTPHHGR